MKLFIVIPVALLLGAAAFIALLMIVKGGYFATKRRKTKLGLVRVAGAGLKLDGEDGEESESSDALPDAAKDGAVAVNKDNETNVGTGIDKDAVADAADDVDIGEATYDVTADAAPVVDAHTDELDVSGEAAGYKDTLSVPLESIKEESDASSVAPPPPPPSKPQADAADKHDGFESKPSGGSTGRPFVSRPFSEKLSVTETRAVVKKIVDTPVENPFISGRSPASGDGSAKKTTVIQRRRLPETVKMKDRKVILAEDVAINRDLIAMYFDGSGVKFEFAVNGREVCEKFERDPNAYSLILMDIQMPEMDGYEVSRRIRAMDVEWAKQIPIIAMTGNDQKEDIDLCFEAGMDDHIPKPIDMEVLQEKVFDIITLNAE